MEYSEVNIFDYFRVIKKRRWLIITVTVIAILLAALVTATIPEQYVASVTILLPQSRATSGGAGLAYLSQVFSTAYSPSSAEYGRPYQEMLQSRYIAKKVAKILGLSSYAGLGVYRSAGRTLFTISCKHSDRKFAALEANAFAKALYEYEQESAAEAIVERSQFVAMELKKADENLKAAEQTLINYQRINKTISVESEASVAVNVVARIKYDILAEEAELNNALKFYSPDHPDIIQLRNDIETKKAKLEEEISKAISPESNFEGGMASGVMSNILEKAARSRRLQKMVDVQAAIYRFILEEFEKLKLEKVKTIKPFEIMDPAIPPKFPTIPNVKFNLFLGFMLGFIAGLSLSFFLEYLESLPKK